MAEGVVEIPPPERRILPAGLAQPLQDGARQTARLTGFRLRQQRRPVSAFQEDAAIQPFPGAADGGGVAGQEAGA